MATIEELLHRRTDLSTFVVHFTRDSPAATATANLLNILKNRKLVARSTYGMAGSLSEEFPEVADTQKVVSFTETPLEHAWMMCRDIENREFQFNGYGLAFTKTFARRRGANPVWYLDITPGAGVPGGRNWLTNPINDLVKQAKTAAIPEGATAPDPAELAKAHILRLTPFFEQMGPTRDARKEFWWEREWRHVGDLKFDPKDIVVVFAPENEHPALLASLTDHLHYRSHQPALVDAEWGLERMIGTLAGVADLGPFPE